MPWRSCAGVAREDPRPAAAEALRLSPEQPEAQEAVKAFRSDRPARVGAPCARAPALHQVMPR